MSADTELFRMYEIEFLDFENAIRRDIPSLKTLSGDSRERVNNKINKSLEKANEKIRHMEIEANSIVNVTTKEQLKQQVQKYKEEIRQMKKEHQEADKHYLFGEERKREGHYDDEEMEDLRESSRFKQRMEQNTRMLEDTSETSHRIIQMTNEIEEQAIETASTLKEQGDQIRSTRSKVHDLNSDLRTSGSIIGRMSRRQILQKVIMVVIILVLLAIIGLILFFILRPYISLPEQ
jgi:hypothetical protein